MDYKNLTTESSIIDLQEHFISIINLKNKIQKSFNTKTIYATETEFSYKVIRFARLFGAPVFFPNPTFNVRMLREKDNMKIKCELIVFDYFFVNISIILLGIVLFFDPTVGIRAILGISTVAFIFGNIAVLLDSKYFFHLLKKELKEEINQYKV